MSEESIRRAQCSKCGAAIYVGESQCWLCSAPPDQPNNLTSSSSESPSNDTASTPVQGQMRLATMFLLMTLAAVIVAVFVAVPGLGILLAIVSTPPLIRTMLVVYRRAEVGAQVRSGQKILLFLSSLGTITVVTLLAVCSSIGTFCGICLSSGENSAIPIATLCAIVTASVTLFFCGKWIRNRWRRDTRAF